MSWRTVVVAHRCKLDLKMGYMVIRGQEVKRVYLDEIALLMIENPAVSLTGCLLEALNNKKIRVIFCDAKRSPYAELMPYYGSFDSARKLKNQAQWQDAAKGNVWREIVREKIAKQADHLIANGKQQEAALLRSYLPQLEPHDTTNREGHAAKVYFNALFGMEFTRGKEDDPVNAALNYGYGIILSAFNRSVNAMGYSTQMGIHHDNVFNHYNLSSDLMEPFRILVDIKVKELDAAEFTKEVRYELVDILNREVLIDGTRQTVLNAIDLYVRSAIRAIAENDTNQLRFYHV